jgi:alkyldihydroxyacetonephosphate synthase
MRRWNGWGDYATVYPLHITAGQYLRDLLGDAPTEPDASFNQILASIPASGLPDHPLITTSAEERLRHSRGQSLPDWIALRSGKIDTFTDGVAYPRTNEDVRALFDYAHRVGAHLIPYGGGTSVVGHITPLSAFSPTLTVNLSRMNQIVDLDETSHLAAFQAGVNGPTLESELRKHGFTLGHYPQSFELSTLGGWIATRSSGQQSYHYGRIEDLFAGGHLVTPMGSLDLPQFPASAAGPDLRQMILGSEGRFGIITQANLRIRPLPQAEAFYGIFFKDWPSGVAAVRTVVQAGIPVSMLRLSDPQETEITLILSGKDNLVKWANLGLSLFGFRTSRCLLILAVTGNTEANRLARRNVLEIIRSYGGLHTGGMIGSMWRKNRFLTPYLRNTLWEHGYALDTLETAVSWSAVLPTASSIRQSLEEGLSAEGERLLVFSHLSHVYSDGASIYTTFLYRRSKDPDETLHRWQVLKAAASHAIIERGGTISHQHGVGLDHLPYLKAEKGILGMAILESTRQCLDPEGLLNPGKLLPG